MPAKQRAVSTNPAPETKQREEKPQMVSASSIGHLDSSKLAKEQRPNYRPHFFKTAKYRPYTILDSPEWHSSQFLGFYVLFWVVVTVLVARILLMNFLETGRPLQTHVISILSEELLHVAMVDLVMYLALYPVYFGQLAVSKGYINWESWGWILQHVYQITFLVTFVLYARMQQLPWIAQIFLTLHALVQLMKMHSFAVFNGYMKIVELKVKQNKPRNDFDKIVLEEARKELEIYPKNLTLHSFFMYTMYPTVVYEFSYPRTEKIRWGYAAGKIAATLGVFLCMIVVSEQMMHPVAVWANSLRENGTLLERIQGYPLVFLKVFPPFILLYLLTFFIIWDAILNSIAELSRFGDREFYRDWWNSTDWSKFARDWNVPVHNFLQRHVYTSSRLFLNLSRTQAMFFTFLLSSAVHELAMWVIFGRVRGFLFMMQLTQLPMQILSKLKFFSDRPRLGLVMFWFGIALGPSILCSMYLTF